MAETLSYRRWLERSLWFAVFTSMLAAALLVARNRLPPEQHPLTFGLFFWIAFALLHAAIAVVVATPIWLVTRRLVDGVREALFAAVTLAVLAVTLYRNTRALANLVSLPGPALFKWLLPAGVALALAGLIVLAVAFRDRRWPARMLGCLGIAALLLALWPERPSGAAAATLADSPLITGTPLIVLGIDGADWRYVEQLMARDEMPNLRAFRERGVWGPLQTLKPALSPRIWTTLVTGCLPEHHGITDFVRLRVSGVDDTLPSLLPVKGLGYGAVTDLIEAAELRYQSPMVSTDRRVPAYWNVATLSRSPVAVVGWMATWPAEPVLGYVVSDRLYWTTWEWEQLCYPPGLFGEIRELVRKERVPGPDQTRFIEAADRSGDPKDLEASHRRVMMEVYRDVEAKRRVCLELLARGRRKFGSTLDLLVMFRALDIASHDALRYSDLIDDHLDASAEDCERFGGYVAATHTQIDRAVGEILAVVGDANVVVLSDHGFGLERVGDKLHYSHTDTAPDGIFIAAGPAFARGRLDGLTVHEVFPLLLRARGLPMTLVDSRRVEARVFRPEFLESETPRVVEGYGPWRARLSPRGTRRGDEEIMEDLRALGYVE